MNPPGRGVRLAPISTTALARRAGGLAERPYNFVTSIGERGAARLIKHFTATGFLVRDGAVLLLWHRKLRMWLPFGGHLDPDEDPIEALRREASEETGFEIEVVAETLEFHTEGVRALPAPETILLERIEPDHYHIDLIYFVRSVGGQARLAPDEHSEMRWFTHAELGSAELTNDVRVLGRRAIERMGSNGA